MADPKYANLYGIAHDQPDVYETSDLPEADQPGDIFDERSEAIERLHISAPEAFSKFQRKELDADNVDFSDHIGRSRGNGYNIRSNNWELAGFGEKETPLEKYNRLKLEIEHLAEEVSALPKNTPQDSGKITNTLAISYDEANQLRSKLTDLKLEDRIGLDFADILSHPERLHFEKLLNHLDSLSTELRKKPNENKATLDAVSIVKNAVQYTITLRPNQQMQFISRITDLEQRINKLETLIGSNTNQVIRLCNTDVNEGLINCSQWMIAKLSLLDSTQLDAIESKISNVNAKTEQFLNTYNSLARDPEKEKKINDLYELCNKAKEKSDSISNIVERLFALESMHRQGKQSVQTVTHLENLQSEFSANLTSNNNSLNNIKENLQSNIGIIKENVQSLKARVDALMDAKK